MIRRFKAVVEYDGSDFKGWQYQPGVPTVQHYIEQALEAVTREKIRITAAGRTDAGVHALGQVISFITESTVSTRGLMMGTNANLPYSVRLVSLCEVDPNFDPRRNAILRWYRYQLLNRSVSPVWGRRFIAHYPYPLDMDLLQKAMALFRGQHDFSAFRSSGCEAMRTELNMELFRVYRKGDLFSFHLRCRSFLYNMVRILMGSVLGTARGRLPLSHISNALESGIKDARIKTAPPHGLVLMKVYYPGEPIEEISPHERF